MRTPHFPTSPGQITLRASIPVFETLFHSEANELVPGGSLIPLEAIAARMARAYLVHFCHSLQGNSENSWTSSLSSPSHPQSGH